MLVLAMSIKSTGSPCPLRTLAYKCSAKFDSKPQHAVWCAKKKDVLRALVTLSKVKVDAYRVCARNEKHVLYDWRTLPNISKYTSIQTKW
jgi:hypothetical protein